MTEQPTSNLCAYDELRTGDVRAGFGREMLGGEPVLTIADSGAPVDSWVTLSLSEAKALREWLNGTLGAVETSPVLDAALRRLGENDEEIMRLRGALTKLARLLHEARTYIFYRYWRDDYQMESAKDLTRRIDEALRADETSEGAK